MTLFDEIESEQTVDEDSKYTYSITAPQYIPKGDMPSVYSLRDTRKYEELCKEIDESDVSDEDKKFLKDAATRHIVFRYDRIAEYYCHASVEMQRLMEKSALVVIDYEDAIRNGYVKLDKKLAELAVDALKRRGDIKDDER